MSRFCKQIAILIYCVVSLSFTLNAQPVNKKCSELLVKAIELYKSGNYEMALKKLSAVKLLCPDLSDSVDTKNIEIFTDINRQKKIALQEKAKAIENANSSLSKLILFRVTADYITNKFASLDSLYYAYKLAPSDEAETAIFEYFNSNPYILGQKIDINRSYTDCKVIGINNNSFFLYFADFHNSPYWSGIYSFGIKNGTFFLKESWSLPVNTFFSGFIDNGIELTDFNNRKLIFFRISYLKNSPMIKTLSQISVSAPLNDYGIDRNSIMRNKIIGNKSSCLAGYSDDTLSISFTINDSLKNITSLCKGCFTNLSSAKIFYDGDVFTFLGEYKIVKTSEVENVKHYLCIRISETGNILSTDSFYLNLEEKHHILKLSLEDVLKIQKFSISKKEVSDKYRGPYLLINTPNHLFLVNTQFKDKQIIYENQGLGAIEPTYMENNAFVVLNNSQQGLKISYLWLLSKDEGLRDLRLSQLVTSVVNFKDKYLFLTDLDGFIYACHIDHLLRRNFLDYYNFSDKAPIDLMNFRTRLKTDLLKEFEFSENH